MRVAAARAAEAVPVVMVDVLVVETAAAPRVVVMMAAVAMAEAAAEAAVKVVAAECSLLLVHRCHSPRSCRRRRHHCGHAPCTSTCNGLWTGEGAARTLQPCRDVGLSSWNQAAMCSWHDAAMYYYAKEKLEKLNSLCELSAPSARLACLLLLRPHATRRTSARRASS